jgi:PAS domain S-box-containing protein
MRLDFFLNSFLTSGVKLADPEAARRIKVLNVFEVAFILAAASLGLFYEHVGAVLLSYVCFIAGALGLMVILLLRLTKNPALAGNFAVFIFWATLVLIRWNTGAMTPDHGLMLLTWVWNAVLILLAIFMTGYQWGSVWACLVFIESGFAVYLVRSGHYVENLIPLDMSTTYALGSYLTGLLAVLLFAFLFEKERHDTLEREEEKTETLRQSRRYVEDILTRSPVPTFVLDRNHRVVQWNRACEQMTGIPHEEILGKRICEDLSLDEEGCLADKLLDDPDALAESYRSAVVARSDSGSFAVESFLPKLRGGMRAIVNTAPILDQDGKVKGAIQTIQDISSRGNGPRSGSNFTKGGSELSLFPVFKIDNKGKISSWNVACEEMFGYSSSRMVGSNPLALLAKPYRARFRDAVVRVFKGETLKGQEWKYYNGKGEPVYVLVTASPIKTPAGKIGECVFVHTEITDLRMKLRGLERKAIDNREKLKNLEEEHALLKKNIASFIRTGKE